jgi:hypothetical protein
MCGSPAQRIIHDGPEPEEEFHTRGRIYDCSGTPHANHINPLVLQEGGVHIRLLDRWIRADSV